MKLRNARTAVSGGLLAIGCLIYFVVAPVNGFGLPLSWHDEQRAMQLVLLLLAAVVCVVSPVQVALVLQPAMLAMLAALLALGLLSATTSQTPFDSLGEVTLHVALGGLSLAFASIVKDEPEEWCRRVCVAAVFIGAAYLTGVATKYTASVLDGRPIDVHVVMLGYLNPRFPSALHALLLPFVAAAALDDRLPRLVRLSAFVVGAGLWATNLGLATRGIWLVFALVCAAAVVVPRWNLRKLALAQAILAGAGTLAYWAAVRFPTEAGVASQLQTRTVDLTSLSFRDQLWLRSLQLTREDPLLGAGPMRFATDPHQVAAHPHNWFLQIAAEWGLPAMIMTVVLVVLFCLRALSAGTMNRSIVQGAPAFALLVFLSYGLIDGIHVMPVSQTLGFLITGVALGVASVPAHGAGCATNRSTVALAVVLSSAFFVSYYALSTYERQRELQVRLFETVRHKELSPRFWEQGLLLAPTRRE